MLHPTGSRTTSVVLAWLAATGLSTAHAQPTPPAIESMSIVPGVVVAPSKKTVYVMDAKDGVVALDLATGKLRWAARKLAAKPFAVRGNRLVALDESGAVRVLDARTGKLATKCSTVPDIRLALVDGLGSNQHSSGVSDDKRIWITWARGTHYAGGAAPTPEMEKASRSQSGGVYEIDVDACTQKAGVDPYAPTRHAYTTPTGTRFSVEVSTLQLAREVRGVKSPPLDLRQGNANRHQMAVSSDRRHVAVGEYKSNQGPAFYEIEIFDVDTGASVAKAKLSPFPTGFVLVGRKLVYGAGLAVVFDLDRQKQIWVRGVRPTAYAGPYPPSAPPRR